MSCFLKWWMIISVDVLIHFNSIEMLSNLKSWREIPIIGITSWCSNKYVRRKALRMKASIGRFLFKWTEKWRKKKIYLEREKSWSIFIWIEVVKKTSKSEFPNSICINSNIRHCLYENIRHSLAEHLLSVEIYEIFHIKKFEQNRFI